MDLQAEIELVVHRTPKNEAYGRCLLDCILIHAVAAEKKAALLASPSVLQPTSRLSHSEMSPHTSPGEPPAELSLKFETPLSYKVIYKSERRLFSGIADYTLFYNSKEMMDTNLVVKVKERGFTNIAAGQLVGYLGR